MACVLAMLVVATSLQPAQARFISGEGNHGWSASEPSSSNPFELLDGALYISEENDEQIGRKGPSHRLGLGDPLVVITEVPPAASIPIRRYVPPHQAPPADSGLFLSPLKTGPPSL